jgi:hypothetical protein
MTAAELIAELQKFDPDTPVLAWEHSDSWADWLEEVGPPILVVENHDHHKNGDGKTVKVPFLVISG